MLRTLPIILFSSLITLSANAKQFTSIGSCYDIKEKTLQSQILQNGDEVDGLIVSPAPNPEAGTAPITVAETIKINKISATNYRINLEPDSIIGEVSGSYEFSLTEEGSDWVGKFRTYHCKLD